WQEVLEHSEPDGVLATLLRTLIGSEPEWYRTTGEESAPPAQESNEASAAYRELQQRLTAGESGAGQHDLHTLLEMLATDHPEQLQQLYRDLRNGHYDPIAAQLNAIELHSLIERLLRMKSTASGADRLAFLQAITHQADHVDDQESYYRRILEDLLQEREIDLEAIAALARQPLDRSKTDHQDWDKQTGTEATKGAETAGKADAKVVADSTRQIRTGHTALYARITAALHKAGLTGEQSAVTATAMEADELRQRLRALLHTIAVRDGLEKLPQSSRMDIAYLLSPQAALWNEHLLVQADTLYRITKLTGQSNRQQWEQRLWAASLRYLLTLDTTDIAPAAYLQALARELTAEADPQVTLRAWYEALEQRKASGAIRTLLRMLVETSAVPQRMEKENQDSSRVIARAEENALSAAQKPPLLDWDALLKRVRSTDDVYEEIYIENAGQVLAAPYLPRLFGMLKLVEDGAFVDRRAAERAVHLLQFMVNEQTRSPEYQLTLNKILCGVTTGIPICREIDISVHEQETIEGLICGMIQNWQTIGNTSISGLRETFLQRKGKLQLKEDGMWYLTVEPGVFDMLLDSLPWSYSVIKHSWMERAVHVTWR
ncbi:MAG: hypothetical protein JSR71_07635, partial [Proteobacteria bacterium]|nr:hypothetical protein [Pseudomonadota bacterium]